LKKSDFDRVIKSDFLEDKFTRVYYSCNDQEYSRVGIVVSKRNLPRAVDRNRIKRVIRETIRLHQIFFFHVDFVVMVKSACKQRTGIQTDNLSKLFNLVQAKCEILSSS